MKTSQLVVLETIVSPKEPQNEIPEKVAEKLDINSRAIKQSIFRLRCEQYKLDQTNLGLRKQDRVLFERAMRAVKENNKKAEIKYTTKILETRKTIKFLFKVELGIERFVMQLEAKLEIGDIDVTRDRKPASFGLRSMFKELSKILPDVSNELENVCDLVEGNLVVFGFKNENAVLVCYTDKKN